jgi:hypothetical protein
MSLSAIHRRIVLLEAEMAKAAAAEDFEAAAQLRNEITQLRGQDPDRSASPLIRKPPPGQMGLGTQMPVGAPPKGWQRPKKPDPMTSNVKPRRGR